MSRGGGGAADRVLRGPRVTVLSGSTRPAISTSSLVPGPPVSGASTVLPGAANTGTGRCLDSVRFLDAVFRVARLDDTLRFIAVVPFASTLRPMTTRQRQSSQRRVRSAPPSRAGDDERAASAPPTRTHRWPPSQASPAPRRTRRPTADRCPLRAPPQPAAPGRPTQ